MNTMDWLATAFTATNALRALFFVPQVVAVARSDNGARDISLATWWMWTLNNGLGAWYACVAIHHTELALSFAASAVACVVTIAITMFKRWQLRTTAQCAAPRQSVAAG